MTRLELKGPAIIDLAITYAVRVLPSLSITNAVTVPSLFRLVGVAISPKSISVFEMVLVLVLLFFLFSMIITVSAVYVAVILI